MADKTARTHSHVSNRAKHRENGERKIIFKSVLDNPFRIYWPSAASRIQSSILDLTIAALDGPVNCQLSRKRKRNTNQQELQKKRKLNITPEPPPVNPISEQNTSIDGPSGIDTGNKVIATGGPTTAKHLVMGINQVTKRLEAQIRERRATTITNAPRTPAGERNTWPLQIILVCCADVQPSVLIAHIPHLVAAYNSLQPQLPVKLVPLPVGAEVTLSRILGLRRVAVLGLDVFFPNLDNLMKLLDPIPALTATWLASSTLVEKVIIPTHIKQIRTSAPKDMKAEKQRRREQKALRQGKGRRTLETTPPKSV